MGVTRTESGAVTLIGGELIEFSDLEPVNARAALAGPVVAGMLEALVRPGSTVLLAGPYSVEVTEQVVSAAASVDLLVRSYPDAEALTERFGDRIRVYAGGLDRFGTEHGRSAYDVVVALDVARLFGPDSRDLAWDEAVAALSERVASQGRLAVAAANRLGLDRLVDARTAEVPTGDDEWPRTVTTTPSLRSIQADQTFAVFPDMENPALAIGVPSLVEHASDQGLQTLVAAAMARAPGDLLTDPYRLTRDTVAAGLGAELAPGWILVTGGQDELPSVIPAVEWPRGSLVEELVFDACRLDDQVALRRVIESYVGWLRNTGTPGSADNVLVDGDQLTLLRPVPAKPVDDAVTVGCLRQLVVRLMASGVRLPWPTGGTPRHLTALLAAMAGIELDDDLWRRAGGHERPAPAGYVEALGTISRLSGELADAQGQIRGLEADLRKVRGSVALRVGRMVTAPLKAVYRTLGVRWLVRKIR